MMCYKIFKKIILTIELNNDACTKLHVYFSYMFRNTIDLL